MLCTNCGQEFPANTVRWHYCSDKCRSAAWHRKREDREPDVRKLARRLARRVGLQAAEDLA